MKLPKLETVQVVGILAGVGVMAFLAVRVYRTGQSATESVSATVDSIRENVGSFWDRWVSPPADRDPSQAPLGNVPLIGAAWWRDVTSPSQEGYPEPARVRDAQTAVATYPEAGPIRQAQVTFSEGYDRWFNSDPLTQIGMGSPSAVMTSDPASLPPMP